MTATELVFYAVALCRVCSPVHDVAVAGREDCAGSWSVSGGQGKSMLGGTQFAGGRLRSFTLVAALVLGLLATGLPAASKAYAANGSVELEKSAVFDSTPTVSNVSGASGSTFIFQLAYTCVVNSGYTCDDVTISDDLPDELEIVGDYPQSWTVDGNHVEIPIGDIGPGAGTRDISVRFRTDTSYEANQEVTAENTAEVSYTISGNGTSEDGSRDSNTVVVTGVVSPIGGAGSSKSITPGTVQEFSGAATTVKLIGTNSGTDVAEMVISDVDGDFFDAFDLSQAPTVVTPDGASSATVEVLVSGSWVPVPSTLPADIDGIRVRFVGVPGGESGSLSFTATLRDHLSDGTTEVVTGNSNKAIVNTSTVSTSYTDSSINASKDSNATVTVTPASSGSVVLAKTVTPNSVIVGSTDPIVYQLKNSWSPVAGALGGLRTIEFTDPVAGGDNPFDGTVDITGISVTWPGTTPQSVTLVTNCGTTGPVTRTGATQSITLPCAGDEITSLKITFQAADGSVYPANASATVAISTVLEPAGANTSRVSGNDASVTTTSAYGGLTSTDEATDVSLTIQDPVFNVTSSKRFAKPRSSSPNNLVILTGELSATPSNATVDSLVVQDPPQSQLDNPGNGTDFYDQYDITGLRPLSCPSGYSALVEIWNGTSWVVPASMSGDACGFTDIRELSTSERAVATGIRIAYTRPPTGVSTVTVQPQITVELRDTNRDTGASLSIPTWNEDGEQTTWDSNDNCSTVTAYRGTSVVDSETTTGDDCVSITHAPPYPATGGGFGLSKVVSTTRGGAVEPNLQEFSGGTFWARLEATQTGAMSDVSSVSITDPTDTTSTVGTGLEIYQPRVASQIFASATNLQQILSNAVPSHERAVLQGWNVTSGTWVPLQTVLGNGTATINYTFAASTYDTYGGWRIVVDENPANPGDNPGYLESTSFVGSPLQVDVRYQLRTTFRTAASIHAAGDMVLNNLCYGIQATALTEDASGEVLDPCSYSFTPYTDNSQYPNDSGYLINDGTVSASGLVLSQEGELENQTLVSTSGTRVENRDLLITSSVFNADVEKSFWKGSVQDGSGVDTPASVPIPADGAAPGIAQQRTLRISLLNQTSIPLTMTAVDDDPDFWAMFQLVQISPVTLSPAAAGYDAASKVRYTVSFSSGSPDVTGTLAEINALPNLADVDGITVVATSVPAGSTASPQRLNVNLVVQLRADQATTAASINTVTMTADTYGSPFAEESDSAAIKAVPSQRGVSATKTMSLAQGQVNALDLEPVLAVSVGAENSGDLPLASLVIEDDDDLADSDYGTPSVPASLPTNSTSDFWPNVVFQRLTSITYPANAAEVSVQVKIGGNWVSVGVFPTGTAVAVIDAAIDQAATRASIAGVRLSYASADGGIPVFSSAALGFEVKLRRSAPTGSALTNCTEAGMAYVVDGVEAKEYQNPACASFTPALGTLKVDVDKSTTVTSALSGEVVPWTLSITNNGQQAIGLRTGSAPLTVVDQLPSSLVFDASVASITATFPTPQVTSTFADTVLPAATYNAGTNTLTWVFAEGESLGAGETLTIRFSLRVAAAVGAGNTVTNRAGVVMPSASACTQPDTYTAGACTDPASITVSSGGNVLPTKTITGDGENISTNPSVTCEDGAVGFPCVALTPAGSQYTWNLAVQNSGNVNLGSVVLLDRLPTVGDTTIQGNFTRGTEWTPASRGPVTVDAPGLNSGSYTVSYLPQGSSQACFTELSSGVQCSEWVTLPSGTDLPTTAIGLRVAVPYSATNGMFVPGTTVSASWPEVAPDNLAGTADVADASGVAVADGTLQQWNNISARVMSGSTALQVSSYKAGAQFDSAAFDIRKVVDESTIVDPADFGPFTITAVCSYQDEEVFNDSFELADGETYRINGLPSGTTCQLTEEDAPADFTWANDEDPETAEVGDYTITYDPQAPATVTAVLTNVYDGEIVLVDKLVRGASDDSDYGVTVTCTYKGEDLTLNDGEAGFTINPDDSGQVTGLPVGAECTVVESDPKGASYSDGVAVTNEQQVDSDTGSQNPSLTFEVEENQPTVVTFTNTYTSDLSVAKSVEAIGPVPLSVYGPFTIEVTCPVASGDQTLTFTDLRDGDSRTWSEEGGAELLAGSACTVTETVDGGATSTTVNTEEGTSAEIELSQGANAVPVTNVYGVGQLVVSKVQRGDTGETLRPSFEVTCEYNGEDITEYLPSDQSSFDLASGESKVIEDLPIGTSCTATETDNVGADRTEVTTSGVTVEATEATADVAAEPATVLFTNTYLAELEIAKQVADTTLLPASAFGPFAFEVTCTNPDGETETVQVSDLYSDDMFGWSGELELLAGASCTVTETETGGAQQTTINGSAGATLTQDRIPQGVTRFDVENTFEPLSLTVSKETENAPSSVDPAEFSLTCTYLGQDVTEYLSVSTFSLAGGEELVIDGLPEGTACAVTEVDEASAASVEVVTTSGGLATFDPDDESPVADVTFGIDDRAEFTNIYPKPATVNTGIAGGDVPGWLVPTGLLLLAVSGVGLLVSRRRRS